MALGVLELDCALQPPGGPVKMHVARPYSRLSDSAGLDGTPEFELPVQVLGNVDAAGSRTTLLRTSALESTSRQKIYSHHCPP